MDNFQRWKAHVETIIRQRVVDNLDHQQKDVLKENVKQVETKISSLNVHVQDYRDQLEFANGFYKLYEEVELWLHQKTQQIKHINTTISEFKTGLKSNVKEIELVLSQIDENIDEQKNFNDTKIKKLSEIAVKIQGSN